MKEGGGEEGGCGERGVWRKGGVEQGCGGRGGGEKGEVHEEHSGAKGVSGSGDEWESGRRERAGE